MKYKAKYSAESDIPDDVKSFYKLKNGEWVFDHEEFEGLDALSNPGLAANRDALKQEKIDAQNAKKAADEELEKVNKEIATLKKPGTKIVSEEDSKTLEEYKAIGTVKDIKEKLDNQAELSTKLAAVESEKEVRNLAKKLGLNEDALVDFKLNSIHGKDVVLGVDKKKVKNKKNEEEEVEYAVVVTTDEVNGKKVDSKKDFAEYAKEKNIPQYLVDAIFAKSDGNSKSGNGNGHERKTDFRVPRTVTRQAATGGEGEKTVKSAVDRFNANRSTRKLPWSPKEKSE